MSEEIKFDLLGVGELISQNDKLSVPIYQRAYAWEEKNIDDLFNDIKVSINDYSKEYFLGTIVLSEKDRSGVLEIIDGQQRITSIVILFSCLRDYFQKKEEKEFSHSINNDFISSYNRGEEKNIPKLTLSETDNSFFENYIVNGEDLEKPSKSSHCRIAVAKKYFLSNLERENNLKDWCSFIEKKLKVIVIRVPDETNAFTIFETLNDRGLELAQIDLLKNFLYSKANKKLKEIQSSWIELIAKIESAKDENLILTYIRHYWSSRYGLTREKNKELYTGIKKKINNQDMVVHFVDSLKKDTNLYLAILNHNDSYWKDKEQEKGYIETLNFFQLEQVRPLLLAILKNFQELEIKKSLKIIVSWLVRNLITGTLGGGTLEKEYANKAKKIFNEEIKNTKQLKDDLKNLIPSDSVFKERFTYATVRNEKYARYYLRAIENQLLNHTSPELKVKSNPDEVTLEHILPKKYSINDWPKFNNEQLPAFLRRIGNLTILSLKLNDKAANSSLNIKKKYYKDSGIQITKDICQIDEWTPESIKERQENLADIAIKVWNLNLE